MLNEVIEEEILDKGEGYLKRPIEDLEALKDPEKPIDEFLKEL